MDGFTNTIYNILEAALSILPESPFSFLTIYSAGSAGQWLSWLNWFIPINLFIVILETWLSAILIYYICSIIFRWVKVIE